MLIRISPKCTRLIWATREFVGVQAIWTAKMRLLTKPLLTYLPTYLWRFIKCRALITTPLFVSNFHIRIRIQNWWWRVALSKLPQLPEHSFHQIEVLFGTPFPVFPESDDGYRSSYGNCTSPYRFFKLLSWLRVSINCSISAILLWNLLNASKTCKCTKRSESQ